MSNRILALDCASRLGWSSGDRSGVADFSPPTRKADRATWRPGKRWTRFTVFLKTLHEQAGPFSAIVVEQPGRCQKSGAAAEVAYGFLTHTQAFCEWAGVRCVEVAPAALKRWATGNGNASKEEMQAAAEIIFGRAFPDHNEADACLLWAYAEAGFPAPAPRRKRGSR